MMGYFGDILPIWLYSRPTLLTPGPSPRWRGEKRSSVVSNHKSAISNQCCPGNPQRDFGVIVFDQIYKEIGFWRK